MTDRAGLGVLEAAVIETVGRLSGPGQRYVRCSDVLDALDAEDYGAAYLYPVIQDLTVWWRRHLPLLDGQGNFGSPGNDPAADATYTEVRLSPIGRLTLASHIGDVGPLPLALIEGTAYRGGTVPPFEPILIVDTLRRLLAHPSKPYTDADLDLLAGPPSLPTFGTVDGDLPALLAGEAAEMQMSCRVELIERHGRQILEITGFPLTVDADHLLVSIGDRARHPDPNSSGGDHVADLQDHTTGREHTIRQWVVLRQGADPVAAEDWLRSIWPVTIDVTWQLPAPMSHRLRSTADAIAEQSSGLRQLHALL